MKADVIIQARMGSTRLPGKAMMEIEGRPILEHVISRAAKAETTGRVIVATSVSEKNKPIIKLAERLGAFTFSGSEDDVLDRFYEAAKLCNCKDIVRITADCPFIDPAVIDEAINLYFKTGADYCTNIWRRTYPDGQDVDVFSFAALAKASKETQLASDREHVVPFFNKNRSDLKVVDLKSGIDMKDEKWSIDNKEDLEFARRIARVLYPKNPFFGIVDIAELLKRNPDIRRIRSDAAINEGYAKSLREDRYV